MRSTNAERTAAPFNVPEVRFGIRLTTRKASASISGSTPFNTLVPVTELCPIHIVTPASRCESDFFCAPALLLGRKLNLPRNFDAFNQGWKDGI
jgi:hypothetical protein